MAASLSDEQKIAAGRAMAAAWKAMDWRKVADMFTPDGVLHSMMVDPIVGREAVYKRVAGLGDGLESITLNISHMGVVDGILYMERVDEFVIRGKAGSAPVVGVLEFDGPLISVWREYYDRAHLLKNMGLVEDFDQKTR
ncbi:MAG: nuclear transport factor 2 family protein [Alphaproteobacteria bacterium]|nr:nuclear transport factor 2 family protein [Alphaproteobacteria bacterium]MBU1513084.1 nuclear transport factor 2 family protein [Alphaproteobacteria bacterium]MBU2095192.1 nuclear transport factor 2 family protein [Alphaproteobacteria bacterium]MBU2150649.1 nuclear transport factor 2 family protein [Alphaproteobacteria bacterium]MBU2306092.1 nuclear transport factor 2 family protein [Alphaproteobacteria bacterium]